MAEITRRFRASGTIPYAQAILELVTHARTSSHEFDFGPVGNVSALLQNGLSVTGDEDTVSAISDLLEEKVPGLYPAESLGPYNGCIERRRAGWWASWTTWKLRFPSARSMAS